MAIDFEITRDREFLKHFWNHWEIFKFSPELVDKLRCCDDPYGKYGYGQWLYNVRPAGDESVKEALACFKYAAMNGVPDALAMISYMEYMGDYYEESKGGIWEKNNALALAFNAQAQKSGSELALLHKNYNLFWGNIVPADEEAAIEEAIEKSKESDVPFLWLAQLGDFYKAMGLFDEAIEAYEQCIAGGYYYPMLDLALTYYDERGDVEKYDSLMKEGIEKEVADCMIWGIAYEDVWDDLSPERQKELHDMLEVNLNRGIELGSSNCAYILAMCKFQEMFGFEKDIAGAMRIARKGMEHHNSLCSSTLLDIIRAEGLGGDIPRDLILSDDEYALLVLKSVRYGDWSRLELMVDYSDEYVHMGYGEEMKFWAGKLKERKEREAAAAQEDDAADEPMEKTGINPAVIVVHPSGYTEFVDADVSDMSLSEMGALIGADSLDTVHFSNPLTHIAAECGLDKKLTMYVDRSAVMKDLDDNAVGTMLYGQGYEIRGAVIIAMEDDKYDIYPFDTEEDIENVFRAIDNLTGLLRR